jgi:signal transduction histidine kinase
MSISDEIKTTEDQLKYAQLAMIRQEKLATIGQLAAGIAHELNNPLGFISSNYYVMKKYFENFQSFIKHLENLMDSEFAPDTAEVIDRLLEAYKVHTQLEDIRNIFDESDEGFRRVSGIVDNLLAFARADSDKKTMNDINLGIKSTAYIAVSEFKHAAELTMTLGDIPELEYNAGEINQVILNLLLNAVQSIKSQKKTDLGQVVIKSENKDSYALITVTDDGPGIPDEVLSRIFDPFFTTKEPGKGTGLGLSIAYDIVVNRHGGQLDVSSKPGHTEFTFTLPYSKGGSND